MDLHARQQTNRGYSDAMSHSFELALTPAVFGALGWLLDRVLDTSPTFTIVLAVFGVIGTVTKFWLDYDRQMKQHEAEGIWNRKSGSVTTGEHR